ncbi:MAG: ATP-binding protein [Lachnospiraceae bacterium]|nr:ATP-binding protein [Lachnospiraceae bacterium]
MDDIKICPVCGEPKEALFPEEIRKTMRIDKYPLRCLCERTAMEEEERARLQREREEAFVRNRSFCFTDKAMYKWNFLNDDGTVAASEYARKYVDNFDEMKRNNVGILFWGDVGTGKSFLAGCIANALLEKGRTVRMTNFSTIINDLFCCEDKNEYIDKFAKYELLIIDDLGAERNTEYATENVFNVIDRRYRSGLPLIVTTNLSLNIIKDEVSVDKKRIYDRILEMCVPVLITGLSKRKNVATEKLRLLQRL